MTPRAQARRLAGRVRRLGGARETLTWGMNAIARRVRSRVASLTGSGSGTGDANGDAAEPEYTGGREVPPPAVFRAQLAALVERKISVLAVYSGALGVRYNHADQLFELFPELRGKVDRAYFPHANHMFTELAEQRALMKTVLDWFERLP